MRPDASQRTPPGRITPPPAPALEHRRWTPGDWTHSDTLALSGAHRAIRSYVATFSAEFDRLMTNPEANAARIAAIRHNDQQVAADEIRLASFDRTVIEATSKKYYALLAQVRDIEAHALT